MNKIHSVSQYQTKINTQLRKCSAYTQYTSPTSTQSSQINSIIECMLCSGSIKQAHMCPSCCKMFCETCIKNWIRMKKSECPNCSKSLDNSNLLNCSNLGRQIQQALGKSVNKMRASTPSSLSLLSPSSSKIIFTKSQSPAIETSPVLQFGRQVICEKHQMKIDYYCQQCKIGLCSDCAVLTSNHQGHRLCRISHKKQKFKEMVAQIGKSFSSQKTKAISKRQQLMQIAQKQKLSENKKYSYLISHLNEIYKTISSKLQKYIQQRNEINTTLTKDYEEGNKKYEQIEDQINTFSKLNLINKVQQIKEEIQKCNSSYLKISSPDPILVQSQIVPQYEQKTYILDNYTHLKQKGDVLVSQPLPYRGTQWRLKIFPGGIQKNSHTVNQEYLALRLQMCKGFENENSYRCRIEIVNQLNRSKCISFEFQNNFRQGQQWGLDKFIKISTLYSENFIHPTQGFLQIILYVRYLSYFHTLKDQKQIVKQKQLKININSQKIGKMREKGIQLGIKSELLSKSTQSIRQSRFPLKDSSISISRCNTTKRSYAIDDKE